VVLTLSAFGEEHPITGPCFPRETEATGDGMRAHSGEQPTSNLIKPVLEVRGRRGF